MRFRDTKDAAAKREFLTMVCLSHTDTCVEWPFHKNKDGYGTVGNKHAHVVVCETVNGNRPPGHYATHVCGNAGCVNPIHLRWGTPKENSADKHVHGTVPLGEKHHAAKLSSRDVSLIKESTLPSTAVASLFNISPRHVRKIRAGGVRAFG